VSLSLKAYSPLHASLVFLALGCVLPFLQWHHKLPIPSFFSEWLAFGLGLLAALPLLSRRYWEPMRIPRSLLFLLGFIGILIVHVVLQRVAYPQQAFVAAMYILWGALMLWLGNQLGRELGVACIARVLARALLVGALISAAMGLVQHFGWPTPLNSIINSKVSGAIMANLGQPNHLSNYLAMGLASLLYLWGDGKLNRWAAGVLGLVLLFVLALTGSRSSWLYLGAFALLAWIWGRRGNAPGSVLFKVALGSLLAFAIMQWLAHWSPLQGVGGTITPTERLFELASGVDIRLGLWREALQIWLAHPFLGAGFGQFAWQHFMLASEPAITQAPAALLPSPLAGAMYNHSHNLLAQIAAEFGGAGVLLLLAGAGYWLAGCVRQAATLAGWWVAAVLAVLTLHSLLEYPLWYAYFLGLAAILIGAADTHTLQLKLSGLMRAAFGLMLLLGWISLVRIADSYSQLERLFVRQAPPSVQEIERVLQHVRQESILTPYSDFIYALAVEPARAQSEAQLLLTSEVMHFAPTEQVVYRQILLLTLQGRVTDAQVMLKRALAVYPGAAENFLAETSQLEPDRQHDVEPLLATTRIFLQEQKQHAIHPK